MISTELLHIQYWHYNVCSRITNNSETKNLFEFKIYIILKKIIMYVR